MMKKTVYVETTIPSFYFNQRTQPEILLIAKWTRQWWEHYSANFELFSSMAVVEELNYGDHPFKTEKLEFIQKLNFLPITSEVIEIVEIYIARQVMPNDPKGDALHVALATYHQCDILVSWNCRHIVNYRKFEHLRKVNTLLGLNTPMLMTPLELLTGEGNDT
jgi:predicted nucleic acid-binding protein